MKLVHNIIIHISLKKKTQWASALGLKGWKSSYLALFSVLVRYKFYLITTSWKSQTKDEQTTKNVNNQNLYPLPSPFQAQLTNIKSQNVSPGCSHQHSQSLHPNQIQTLWEVLFSSRFFVPILSLCNLLFDCKVNPLPTRVLYRLGNWKVEVCTCYLSYFRG